MSRVPGNGAGAKAAWPFRPWLLVERGGLAESVHQGALVVLDDTGRVRASLGDASFATFPRSSAKPLQALPVVAWGAADKLQMTPAQLAVCCASHSAQPHHLGAVEAILAAVGADESILRCGPHPPLHEETARDMVRRGEAPRSIHHNCSGKHAGMIAAAITRGFDPATYWRADHPVQQEIRATLAELGGVSVEAIANGVDGCGVPAWHLPLAAMASAAARLVSGRGAAGSRAAAAERIFDAYTGHPDMVAGTGRFDTELMHAADRPLLSKGGAEGFHLVAWRENDGTGVALAAKAAAGDARSVDFVTIETLLRIGVLPPAAVEKLSRFHGAPIRNFAGDGVGQRRAIFELVEG